ncbi:DNA invertase [Paraburkholderia sp. 5N]|uniref:DNA invertase n=1 Tax=Paraburkholderia elongata TaxID=2675747 RepID=A0A972NMX3_9BURK|nr:DNA invertase [Paraburkholderia elongata]
MLSSAPSCDSSSLLPGNDLVPQRYRVTTRFLKVWRIERLRWIEIPVPALIDPDTFALAQERLESNRKHASRRTLEPSILQGLVHCRQCGYALYRTSTRSSARKISYYRCLGADAWRYDGHAKCTQRPIRLDLLEHIVWSEIVRLLEDPALIQTELNRRLETARNSSPAKRQQDRVTQDLAQAQKRMDRLLTAYQEDLLSLNELRRRMPALRQREQSLQEELRGLSAQLVDQAAYLRLAETLTAFLGRLRSSAATLDVQDRQRITRLLVKEVVVADDSITIRHSIPTATRPAGGNGGPSRLPGSPHGAHADQSYLLRPWRGRRPLR